MRLSPREVDKLALHAAGALAQKRLARGVRLNHPEATALVASVLLELIRDGRDGENYGVAQLMDLGRKMLGKRHVLPAVLDTVLDAVFDTELDAVLVTELDTELETVLDAEPDTVLDTDDVAVLDTDELAVLLSVDVPESDSVDVAEVDSVDVPERDAVDVTEEDTVELPVLDIVVLPERDTELDAVLLAVLVRDEVCVDEGVVTSHPPPMNERS